MTFCFIYYKPYGTIYFCSNNNLVLKDINKKMTDISPVLYNIPKSISWSKPSYLLVNLVLQVFLPYGIVTTFILWAHCAICKASIKTVSKFDILFFVLMAPWYLNETYHNSSLNKSSNFIGNKILIYGRFHWTNKNLEAI